MGVTAVLLHTHTGKERHVTQYRCAVCKIRHANRDELRGRIRDALRRETGFALSPSQFTGAVDRILNAVDGEI